MQNKRNEKNDYNVLLCLCMHYAVLFIHAWFSACFCLFALCGFIFYDDCCSVTLWKVNGGIVCHYVIPVLLLFLVEIENLLYYIQLFLHGWCCKRHHKTCCLCAFLVCFCCKNMLVSMRNVAY